jgi:hypothetical protein
MPQVANNTQLCGEVPAGLRVEGNATQLLDCCSWEAEGGRGRHGMLQPCSNR